MPKKKCVFLISKHRTLQKLAYTGVTKQVLISFTGLKQAEHTP